MLIRMCHEKKKKRKISVTINNKRQTLRDDHPTGFFYHNHHHHPKKTIISSPHLRSLQLFDRRKKHGIGHHLMWWWRRRRTTQRACTLATDLKASNHIDLLPPWLAWCTPRGARTRTIPSHTFTHTHTHTTVRLSNVSSHVHGKKRCCCCRLCHRPFPPCIPLAFCFQANLNFVFTEKKTTPTKHTAYVQKTLTGFLATRHQGCVLLKWYFDRQCNTYFTKQIFI